jgi:hypothetical protein
MRDMPAAFGPKVPKKSLAGILYQNPNDIYGCLLNNDSFVNNETIGISRYYNRSFPLLEGGDVASKMMGKEGTARGGGGGGGDGDRHGISPLQSFRNQLNKHKDWHVTPILLAKRGGILANGDSCTFMDKMKLAQQVGAAALVVYDDRQESTDSNNQPRLVTMVSKDDNRKHQPLEEMVKLSSPHVVVEITIPSLFISKKDGKQLLHLLTQPASSSGDSLTKQLHGGAHHAQERMWNGFMSDFFLAERSGRCLLLVVS